MYMVQRVNYGIMSNSKEKEDYTEFYNTKEEAIERVEKLKEKIKEENPYYHYSERESTNDCLVFNSSSILSNSYFQIKIVKLKAA